MSHGTRTNSLIILLLVISTKLFGQNSGIFNIKTVFKTKAEIAQVIKRVDSIKENDVFFEDERYIAFSYCKGEWGGAIIFKSKRTNQKFICEATCPVTVTKFKGKYILTNTLHLCWRQRRYWKSSIPKTSQSHEGRRKKFKYEKIGQTGANKLIDLYGYAILLTFEYDKKLYHIVSQENETFIAEISNGKLKKSKKFTTGICGLTIRKF